MARTRWIVVGVGAAVVALIAIGLTVTLRSDPPGPGREVNAYVRAWERFDVGAMAAVVDRPEQVGPAVTAMKEQLGVETARIAAGLIERDDDTHPRVVRRLPRLAGVRPRGGGGRCGRTSGGAHWRPASWTASRADPGRFGAQPYDGPGVMLTGWDELDAAFLDRHRAPLDQHDLERFWDGAQPEWRHVLAPDDQVPPRQVVGDAVAVLAGASGATVVLLVGPAGQGKSTAVRQVAAALTGGRDRRVLFRSPGAPLVPEAVIDLPAGTPWILASDDADEIASGVQRAAEALAAAGRHDVHWLLAARETDWERQFPRGEPWDRLATEWPERAARSQALALTEDDASMITKAWGGDSGTPLPGILRSRVNDPTDYLRRTLPLLDPAPRAAFLALAAAEVVGIDGVDLRVMADLTGTPRDRRFALRTALGRAGLGTGSGEALRTRDPSLARAAAAAMEDDFGAVFTGLVRATAETARQTRPLVSDAAIVTGAPTLAARFQAIGIDESRSHEIACAAADAASEALDNLLMTALFRSRTYRAAGAPREAGAILRAAIATAAATDDWGETARSFVCEFSLMAATPEAGVVIAGLSLGDLQGLGPVAMVDARIALARVGELWSALPGGDEAYPRLLRAVAWFGRRVTPNFDAAKQDFRRYAARADELGVPESSAAEAVQWLGEGIATAFATVDDPDIDDLLRLVLPHGSLAFMQLQRTAGKGTNLVG